MQNKIIRFYNIGNVIFQYEGPAIKEKENLALFAVEERQPDFIFRVIEKPDIMLPNLPCIDNKGYIHVYANDVQRDRIIYDNHKDKIMMKDICFDGILHTVEYNPAYIKEFDTNIITKLFDIPYHYFKIGSMKTLCIELDKRIRYRLRMCIWKQWKTPQNRIKNLMKLGVDKDTAWITAYTGNRIAYVCQRRVMNFAINKKRLTRFGLVSMLDYYTERCVTC